MLVPSPVAVALSSRGYYGRLGAIGLAGGFFRVARRRRRRRDGAAARALGRLRPKGRTRRLAGAIIPISAAGVPVRCCRRDPPVEALALAAGSIVGAQAGARLLARADERKLKLAFGAFMPIVAAFMVVGR